MLFFKVATPVCIPTNSVGGFPFERLDLQEQPKHGCSCSGQGLHLPILTIGTFLNEGYFKKWQHIGKKISTKSQFRIINPMHHFQQSIEYLLVKCIGSLSWQRYRKFEEEFPNGPAVKDSSLSLPCLGFSHRPGSSTCHRRQKKKKKKKKDNLKVSGSYKWFLLQEKNRK